MFAFAPRWPSPFPPDVVFCHAPAGEAPRHPLHPEERALLGPRAAPRRVAEFALGRGCAREALARLASQALPERAAELATAPILRVDARQPRWPAGVVGAITHHRGQAAAAVARARDYRGLGLDLEALRAPSPALLRRILRPEERARWAALPEARRAAAFTVVFSAKESLFKALYPHTGVYLGFQDAAVEAGPLGPPSASTASPPDPPSASAASPLDPLSAGGEGGMVGLDLRWRLYKDSGPGLPVGFGGLGRALLSGGYVLTGAWVVG
jgi:4'-phosphopantetheinyl transferase EntD